MIWYHALPHDTNLLDQVKTLKITWYYCVFVDDYMYKLLFEKKRRYCTVVHIGSMTCTTYYTLKLRCRIVNPVNEDVGISTCTLYIFRHQHTMFSLYTCVLIPVLLLYIMRFFSTCNTECMQTYWFAWWCILRWCILSVLRLHRLHATR